MGFVQKSLRGWKLYSNDGGCGHPAPGLGIRQSLLLRTDTADSGTIEAISKNQPQQVLGAAQVLQPVLQPLLQRVLQQRTLGALQHLTLGALQQRTLGHFGALQHFTLGALQQWWCLWQQLFPQPLLQPELQALGAQQEGAGAAQLGAAAGAQQLGAAAGAQQEAGAGAAQLGAAQAGAQEDWQQPLRKKQASARVPPAMQINAAAVNVIHFMFESPQTKVFHPEGVRSFPLNHFGTGRLDRVSGVHSFAHEPT